MKKSFFVLWAIGSLLIYASSMSEGQAGGQYPIADKIADKVIQKYQSSSCQQLAAEKQQPPSARKEEMEQKAIAAMKNDPQMRQYFLNKVAGPIANKLFECGMIP
jgi:hypothetical protein